MNGLPVPAIALEVMAATAPRFQFAVKYDPAQPRVPAGNPDGGQWTDAGGGGGDHDGRREPPGRVIDDPPLEPVYGIELLLGGLTVRGAMLAVRVFRYGAGALEQTTRIRRAARAIEQFLGGPTPVMRNKAGDMVLIRDDKQIRFDINNPSPHKEPHFHMLRAVRNGRRIEWQSVGNKPRYNFEGKEP